MGEAKICAPLEKNIKVKIFLMLPNNDYFDQF
jgi:hypothetical protein